MPSARQESIKSRSLIVRVPSRENKVPCTDTCLNIQSFACNVHMPLSSFK